MDTCHAKAGGMSLILIIYIKVERENVTKLSCDFHSGAMVYMLTHMCVYMHLYTYTQCK